MTREPSALNLAPSVGSHIRFSSFRIHLTDFGLKLRAFFLSILICDSTLPLVRRFNELGELLEVGQRVDDDLLRSVEGPWQQVGQVGREVEVRDFGGKFSQLQLQVDLGVVAPLLRRDHDLERTSDSLKNTDRMGDDIAQRERSHFSPSRPGFDSHI